METKNNFPEIYKGKADLAKFGFSEWQISKINAFCEILQLLYKEGVDPEEGLTTKLVVLKMQCLIADKIKNQGEYYKGYFYEFTEEVKERIEEFFDSEEEVWDKIRKNEEEDPQGTKELSELAFNIATGT